MNNAFDLIENNQENVVIKIISITRSGDEAVRHMVGHIDGVEFIYSDSVDDEMKIRKVLDGVRLSTLVFLVTGIESETDTQVISKISHFTEIAHELGSMIKSVGEYNSLNGVATYNLHGKAGDILPKLYDETFYNWSKKI